MKTNPSISLIVPVFNTEHYLPRFLDSFLHQSFTCFEVLLIDDGSKDSSGSIYDDYVASTSRVWCGLCRRDVVEDIRIGNYRYAQDCDFGAKLNSKKHIIT